MVKVGVIFLYEKEYENIPPPLLFKCLNINTLLITPNKPQQQCISRFMHLFCKNYFGQIQENQ
jgi:hypothetical protein